VSSRADERVKRSVLFAFVAVNTLQIGDEDGEFVEKSAASNGSVLFSFESRGKVGGNGRDRMNITSTERELHKPGGRSRNCFTWQA